MKKLYNVYTVILYLRDSLLLSTFNCISFSESFCSLVSCLFPTFPYMSIICPKNKYEGKIQCVENASMTPDTLILTMNFLWSKRENKFHFSIFWKPVICTQEIKKKDSEPLAMWKWLTVHYQSLLRHYSNKWTASQQVKRHHYLLTFTKC